jgi:hypothetical protein
MDLESTDGSADVARAFGMRVVSRAPVPIVEMVRNEVAAHATGEWILVLDPDERITPGLAAELRRAAEHDEADAVILPRMNCDLGYPPSDPLERYEQQLRMYRRSAVQWPTIPNAIPTVPPERIYRVRSADDTVMLHDRNRNVPEILDRVQRYAVLQAQSMIEQGQVFSARAMVGALGLRASRKFLHGQAWRDGVPGLLRAGVLVGFYFYVWAAFWQLSGARRTPEDDRYVRRIGMALEAARRAFAAVMFPYRAATRLRARVARR